MSWGWGATSPPSRSWTPSRPSRRTRRSNEGLRGRGGRPQDRQAGAYVLPPLLGPGALHGGPLAGGARPGGSAGAAVEQPGQRALVLPPLLAGVRGAEGGRERGGVVR